MSSRYIPSEICCWPQCQRRSQWLKSPLCRRHYRETGELFLLDRQHAAQAKAMKHSAANREAEAARKAERLAREIEIGRINTERRLEREARSVVYYAKIGDRIKIGYTTDLPQRMRSLRVESHNLLATEPGGRKLEADRHALFADYRIGRREDFIDCLAIREHIEGLRTAA